MFRRRSLTALWDLNAQCVVFVTFCYVCFSCYFNLESAIRGSGLDITLTFTFRAFSWRFYATRLTISTLVSCQCHAWDHVASQHMLTHLVAEPRLSLLRIIVPLNVSLSRSFCPPQSNKSIFLTQKVCTGLLFVAEWSHRSGIISPVCCSLDPS